jgi:hypothetical protein
MDLIPRAMEEDWLHCGCRAAEYIVERSVTRVRFLYIEGIEKGEEKINSSGGREAFSPSFTIEIR